MRFRRIGLRRFRLFSRDAVSDPDQKKRPGPKRIARLLTGLLIRAGEISIDYMITRAPRRNVVHSPIVASPDPSNEGAFYVSGAWSASSLFAPSRGTL
jgi:hypothetical protein